MPRHLDGFVLTRQSRDTPSGLALTYWLASRQGPVRVRITNEQAVMFVERGTQARCDRRRELDLTTLDRAPVDAVYFNTRARLLDERDRLRAEEIRTLESDIAPADRYLMERFVTGSMRVTGDITQANGFVDVHNPAVTASDYRPDLAVMSFDIETDGKTGPILSIAAVSDREQRVFMTGERAHQPDPTITYVPDERALIAAFLDHLRRVDPDVLIGWNVIEFDLSYIQRRCDALGVRFILGRAGQRAAILPSRSISQRPIIRMPGRVAIDGIIALRAATYSFERFTLDHVAHKLLGRGKNIDDPADRIEEIRRLYREDKPALAAYNLEDCRLVRDIFARTNLLEFAIERQRMTGLTLDRGGGAVAAFDFLYLPRLHRNGYVADDIGATNETPSSPGGYVLPSEPGLYEDVIVLDFKSLYPSIICTFKIDPMGLAAPGDDPIAGFEGATFARERHILPDLIAALWQNRDRAKQRRDDALSRAIKILMNSFYGVLGTPACRFFSPLLASSITRRGHEIITRSRDWITARGYPVIYGDTDSLFVHVAARGADQDCPAVGETLASELNAWWRERLRDEHGVDSFLDMEFETHYRKFFMPTLRGSTRGSAKRYAGLQASRDAASPDTVIIKGLEAARTDWTPLARRFQRELLRRVFADEPVEAFVRDVRRKLFAGELDGELVYHKRLRRAVDDYKRNVPPHVRAARLLGRPVREVSYVWTTRGPQPIQARTAPLDYDYYVARQLAPASEGILQCIGTSYDDIAGEQLTMPLASRSPCPD